MLFVVFGFIRVRLGYVRFYGKFMVVFVVCLGKVELLGYFGVLAVG